MEKEYEIALSYAHADYEIAEIIKEELENIFANRFFMDLQSPEELVNAYNFEEKLQRIFQKAHYSIILYSENYSKGEFAQIEKKEILNKVKDEKEPHLFIININDYPISGDFSGNPTYIVLKISESKEQTVDWEKIRNEIHSIIHNRIKKFMIMCSIQEKKQKRGYSVNVQTLFTAGNIAQWKMDYDWNLLAMAYVREGERKIKEDTSWNCFWEYVRKDFLSIKEYLNEEPDTIRKIHLNCHLSIAYKLGQIYGDLDQASGNRNLVLLSSNRLKNSIFKLEKEKKNKTVYDFCQEYDGNNSESKDIVCIISIKSYMQESIRKTVENSLRKQGVEYCKLYLFQKQMVIENANDLESMAKYLHEKMISCRKKEGCKIHLFADTTSPLMFVLGAKTIFPGELQLYEYIDQQDDYVISLMR